MPFGLSIGMIVFIVGMGINVFVLYRIGAKLDRRQGKSVESTA
jgi:hypothetical protein